MLKVRIGDCQNDKHVCIFTDSYDIMCIYIYTLYTDTICILHACIHPYIP